MRCKRELEDSRARGLGFCAGARCPSDVLEARSEYQGTVTVRELRASGIRACGAIFVVVVVVVAELESLAVLLLCTPLNKRGACLSRARTGISDSDSEPDRDSPPSFDAIFWEHTKRRCSILLNGDRMRSGGGGAPSGDSNNVRHARRKCVRKRLLGVSCLRLIRLEDERYIIRS